uniref:Integrase catalytic domain-containing protein n=1 Tax=Leptocylindrus aporus TaxID=1398097 RepID=A0A7S0PK03_9STRA|mmetsp:Transcript_1595/g.2155  ORF Transcript_1595/g.2155 Transcript_1595/m.2155 type:complete len:133 (+) Transcript_1595:238-636(+)
MQSIYDNGKEFLGEEFQEMIQSLSIEPTPTTVKNPQANFVERIHLTLGNMLRTMMLEEVILDPDDPWSGILSKLTWAIRSTVHSSLNVTPDLIAFGRDILYDLALTVNWNDLKAKKNFNGDEPAMNKGLVNV